MSKSRKKYILEKKSCCNPFGIHTALMKSGLRPVIVVLLTQFPNLQMNVGQKICTQCRKKLQNWSPEVVEESECSNSIPIVEKGTNEDKIGDGS